jgi:hypothetical protein
MHATQSPATPRPTLSSVLDRLKGMNERAHAIVGRAEYIEARMAGPAGAPIAKDAPEPSGIVAEIDDQVYGLDMRLSYLSRALDGIEAALGFEASNASRLGETVHYGSSGAGFAAKRPTVTDILRKLDAEVAQTAQDGLGR